MKNTKKDILIFFAPNFRQMGCDIGIEYCVRNPGAKVQAICDGQYEVYQEIKSKLSKNLGKIWDLKTEEQKWDLNKSDFDLSEIDKKLGIGYLAKLLISDRTAGYGFVRGGYVRNDNIKNLIKKNTIFYPQRYIGYLYNFVNAVLEESNPKVVFSYAIASSITLILADLCKLKDIQFSTIKPTRIGDYYFIDDTYSARFNTIEKKFIELRRNSNCKFSETTIQFYNNFINSPSMPDYQIKKIQYIKKNSSFILFAKAIKNLIKFFILLFSKKEYEFIRLHRSWFEFFLSINKLFINKRNFLFEIPKCKYIYFSLQVEPEASTYVLSPFHTDQISIIEALAKSAPSDMIILVKEHSPMLGRRPKNYYKTIANIPRVALISPHMNGMDIIKKSEIIATISGTPAWEGLLLNKKVFILGDSPYLCFTQGILRELSFSQYSKSIEKLLSMKQLTSNEILIFIDTVIKNSFKMDSGLIWRGNYHSFSIEERKLAIKNIVDGINNLLTIEKD